MYATAGSPEAAKMRGIAYVSQPIQLRQRMLMTRRFTYSVSFAALMVTAAAELDFWTDSNKAINGGIVYLLIPLAMILMNLFEVEVS